MSSPSSNINDAWVTPLPLYIDIPLVAAVAVSGLACVVFNCKILSSTSTVCVFNVVVVPFIVKLPPTVKLPSISALPLISKVTPSTSPVTVIESTKASFHRTPVLPKSTSLSDWGPKILSATYTCSTFAA